MHHDIVNDLQERCGLTCAAVFHCGRHCHFHASNSHRKPLLSACSGSDNADMSVTINRYLRNVVHVLLRSCRLCYFPFLALFELCILCQELDSQKQSICAVNTFVLPLWCGAGAALAYFCDHCLFFYCCCVPANFCILCMFQQNRVVYVFVVSCRRPLV